jgi:hypothetical protein
VELTTVEDELLLCGTVVEVLVSIDEDFKLEITTVEDELLLCGTVVNVDD